MSANRSITVVFITIFLTMTAAWFWAGAPPFVDPQVRSATITVVVIALVLVALCIAIVATGGKSYTKAAGKWDIQAGFSILTLVLSAVAWLFTGMMLGIGPLTLDQLPWFEWLTRDLLREGVHYGLPYAVVLAVLVVLVHLSSRRHGATTQAQGLVPGF